MNLSKLPTTVNSMNDAKTVIICLHAHLGMGFHPNTPIADYVNTDTGVDTFTEAEISTLQPLLDQCHKVMGDYIYDYSYELYFVNTTNI